MKKNIRIFVLVIIAAAGLTMTAFAAPMVALIPATVAGTFKAADGMTRELAGSAVGIASTIWAVKEFSKKSMFQTIIVIGAGIIVGLLIGQPDWLKTLGNDLINALKA